MNDLIEEIKSSVEMFIKEYWSHEFKKFELKSPNLYPVSLVIEVFEFEGKKQYVASLELSEADFSVSQEVFMGIDVEFKALDWRSKVPEALESLNVIMSETIEENS